MTYYFGFIPSKELDDLIDKAYQLIESNSQERYDVYRDKITHKVNKELMDVMLVELIESLPEDSERKAHLLKVSQTIESTTDKLINTVLSPTPNEQVIPSFNFFDDFVLIKDKQGDRRISVPLDETFAKEFRATIKQVQQGHGKEQTDNLTRMFTQLTQACLQHFLVDFTKTLPLNVFKRGAIPIADSVIKKVLDVAVHRLIPQMPQESLERFTRYYEPLIFEAADKGTDKVPHNKVSESI